MKIYACPEGFEEPEVDYTNFDMQKMIADENAHKERLAEHLRSVGYTGKHTGGVARFGVADGYAQYMLADGKGQYGPSFLIHLGYGDAYSYQGIQHFPKKEIIENIERQQRIASMFGRKDPVTA